MAGSEKEQDRTEQATPFKLREAKQRGQVAKSMEFTAWAVLIAAVAFIYVFGDQLLHKEMSLVAALFSQSGGISLNSHSAHHLFAGVAMHTLSTFMFFALVIIGAGLLANFIQTGPVFSWTPLKVDFSRINPATGFKKFFNVRIIYELVKTLLKLAAFTAVVIFFFKAKLAAIIELLHVEIGAHPAAILHQAIALSLWVLVVTTAVALFDFAFVKWEFAKNMRMSRREVKDEVKRREGDPKVKAKIRELQREAAKRGASLSRIPDADVIITNPTHLSVAIRYERGRMPAPMVIAKGAGELALKMRLKAQQCRVPITENKPLARKLFERVAIDQPILPETYPQVAKILTRIYQSKDAERVA